MFHLTIEQVLIILRIIIGATKVTLTHTLARLGVNGRHRVTKEGRTEIFDYKLQKLTISEAAVFKL